MASRTVHRQGDESRIVNRLVFNSKTSKLICQKSVKSLDCTVCLRVIKRSFGVLASERYNEIFIMVRHKLLAVIGNNFCLQTFFMNCLLKKLITALDVTMMTARTSGYFE